MASKVLLLGIVSRTVIACLVLLITPLVSAATLQLPYPVDHNLIEDAETLKVDPEKLRLARLSLITATELADPVNAKAAGSPMGLYYAWKAIHHSNSAIVLEFLFEKMRTVASAAQTNWYYTWSTTFAAEILSEMARIDPTSGCMLKKLSAPTMTTATAATRTPTGRWRSRRMSSRMDQAASGRLRPATRS